MEPDFKAFLEILGNGLLRGDFDRVAACCAPWVGHPDRRQLVEAIRRAEQRSRDAFPGGKLGPPARFRVEEWETRVDNLLAAGWSLPSGMKKNQFLFEGRLSVRAAEDDWCLYLLQLTAARHRGQTRIGRAEVESPFR